MTPHRKPEAASGRGGESFAKARAGLEAVRARLGEPPDDGQPGGGARA